MSLLLPKSLKGLTSVFLAVVTGGFWLPSTPAVGQEMTTEAAGTTATPRRVLEPVSKQQSQQLPASAIRPRVGLALGGGGTRGAAHVGVLKVLEQEGIPIDYIAGTSMGAVVGGLYSAGMPVHEIEKTFSRGHLMHAFLTVPIPVRVLIVPVFLTPRLFGAKPYDGLYKGNKFRNYLNSRVPQSDHQIEHLKIPFAAVALNLIDGKSYSITRGNLGRALQASSAVPMLRRPVAIEDKLFVDGGVVSNLPVKEARDLGSDIVIAVDVDERFESVPEETFRHIGSVAHRVLTLHLAKVDEGQLQAADIVIHPDVNGISLVSTRKKDARSALLAGEKAARAAIPTIRKFINDSSFLVNVEAKKQEQKDKE